MIDDFLRGIPADRCSEVADTVGSIGLSLFGALPSIPKMLKWVEMGRKDCRKSGFQALKRIRNPSMKESSYMLGWQAEFNDQTKERVMSEALKKIEEAKATGAIELDLSYMSLSELPPEIGQLKNLKRLDLYHNQLSSLPPEIGQLTNLKGLYLDNNQLSELPPEIGQLTNLKGLYLDNNKLPCLPPEIGQLKNLKGLDLYHNQLSSLPPEIGQLTNLKWLYLHNNQLSELPPEIGQLTNLKWLYLHSNQVKGNDEIIAELKKNGVSVFI